MHTTATVTQRFPTWAAANETRERLAQDGGFDRYGIERIDIERSGDEFELLIRTSEFHRDQIEHLLRSSGTMFNAPASERPWARLRMVRSLTLFGAAAVAGAVLYGLLGRRHEEGSRRPARGRKRASSLDWSETREDGRRWQRERFDSDQREGLRSHAEGYAV